MVFSALVGLALMVGGRASPVSMSDTVEVTFRCPAGGQMFTANWEYKQKGSYSEAGKSNDITFTAMGRRPAEFPLRQLRARSDDPLRVQVVGSRLPAAYPTL